jgi:hypothetical protein
MIDNFMHDLRAILCCIGHMLTSNLVLFTLNHVNGNIVPGYTEVKYRT